MKIPIMTDDQVVLTLQGDLGLDFVFDNVDRLMETCESILDEAKQSVTNASELQLRSFCAQKDAIMKYRKEKNFQLNKQEKIIMEKSAQLSEANEALNREIHATKTDIKNVASSKSEKQKQLESLELEEMHHLKKHDANVQNLEATRRCVAIEILFYNRFLGMKIQKNATSDNEFYIELQNNSLKMEAKCRIPVTRNNDGFVFPDGSTASTSSECMKRVCGERKKCCQPTSQI